MAKYPSLVSCNSASVVDSMPRYFAFHGVDLGSGPDHVTIFFLSKYGKCIKYRLLSWRQTFSGTFSSVRSQSKQFSKKFVAVPGTRTREPESSQQKSKSVARYPLHYWDINNRYWIFSLLIKLVCIGHYRHFVFSTWKVHCTLARSALATMRNVQCNSTYRQVLFYSDHFV